MKITFTDGLRRVNEKTGVCLLLTEGRKWLF